MGPVRGGAHDPRHVGAIYIEDQALGWRVSEPISTERVRDSNGFLFKPNGLTPPVGLVPVRGLFRLARSPAALPRRNTSRLADAFAYILTTVSRPGHRIEI